MSKIEIRNLYLIFGKEKHKAEKMLKEGKTKEEILKATGCTVAVKDANLSINEGEIFVIMGLSGSGKSTLLRCINRLIRPTSGEIIINETDISKASKQELLQIRRKELAMVFQHFGLLPHRSVLHNIAFGLELQGVKKGEREKKAMECMQQVGLKGYENQMVGQLSGGMQQRVGLARALANNPEVLLMDEPTSALDVSVQAQVLNLMQNLQREVGLTYLFISHNLSVVHHISDRVGVMYLGRLVELADKRTLFNEPRHPYTRMLLDAIPDLSQTHRRRTPISGEVPNPLSPPTGCPFHPRCPLANERCRKEMPLRQMIDSHGSFAEVACHAAEQGRL